MFYHLGIIITRSWNLVLDFCLFTVWNFWHENRCISSWVESLVVNSLGRIVLAWSRDLLGRQNVFTLVFRFEKSTLGLWSYEVVLGCNLFVGVLVRVIESGANLVLTDVGVGSGSQFTGWNSSRYRLRHDCNFTVSLGSVEGSFGVSWLWMSLEFKWLEMCSGTRVFNIGGLFIDTGARSSRAEPIDLGLKWIWILIFQVLDVSNLFVGVGAWTRVFIGSVSFLPLEDRVKWCHTIITHS